MVYLPSLSAEGTSLSDIFKAYPAAAVPVIDACQALLRGPSPFSEAQREMIAAYVSGLNGCGHCTNTHTGATETLGTPKGMIADLLGGLDDAEIDDKMKVMLGYVYKLNHTPREITKADADAVFEAGWSEQALHDAVAICALFNYFNRYVTGLGLETPPEKAAARGKMLVEVGYEGMIKALKLREKAAAAAE